MTQQIDVYRKWLGIPPEEQPPHHYRLLGVGLFETDADVIANAADRQMAHVRTFQTGQHSVLSQKLLNELAAARITLLDPKRRAAYDTQLQSQLDATSPAVDESEISPPPFLVPPPAPVDDDPLGLASATPYSPTVGAYAAARRKKRSMQGPLVATAVAVVGLLLIVWLIATGAHQRFLPDTEAKPAQTLGTSDHSAPVAKGDATSQAGRGASMPAQTQGQSSAAKSLTTTASPTPPTLTQKPTPPKKAPTLRSNDPSPSARAQSESSSDVASRDEPPSIDLTEEPDSNGLRKAEPSRLPVPDEAAQKNAEETIRQTLFQREFEAATQSDKRKALAKKLLAEGQAITNDPAATYVFFKLACEEAAAAGDIETAFAAVDAVAKHFETTPTELNIAAVEALVKSPKLNTTQRVLLATRMLDATNEAVDADCYEMAERALTQARLLIAKTRDPALMKEVTSHNKHLQENKQAYEKLEPTLQLLKTSPDDAAANTIAGRYYCFAKGNWGQGLKHLAAADDESLRALARRDLARPKANAERMALADAWWELANSHTGLARQHLQQRAGYWYDQLEGLTGLDQSKVRRRLADIQNEETAATNGSAEATLKSVSLECRSLAARPALLKRFGGSDSTELAVARALAWLDKHQNADGSWNFNHRGPRCKDQCPNPGVYNSAPTAATAMALLAFLGNGNSTKEGRYRKDVATGLMFLKKRSTIVNGGASLYEPQAMQIPSHALATAVFCEAAAMTRDKQLRLAAQSLVNSLIANQGMDGGWSDWAPTARRNGTVAAPVDHPSTLLATAWSLMALRSAEWAGIPIPQTTSQRASRFLERRESYAPQSLNHSLGVLGQLAIDWSLTGGANNNLTPQPSLNGNWMQNYTDAVILRQTSSPAWEGWNTTIRDQLLESQAKEGHASGSWYSEGGDLLDHLGGRLLCTTLGTLILENYYRYPTPQ